MDIETRVTFQQNVNVVKIYKGVIIESLKLSYKKFIALGLESFVIACQDKDMVNYRFSKLEKAGYIINPRHPSIWKSSSYKWSAMK